jgi:hypothetical protein
LESPLTVVGTLIPISGIYFFLKQLKNSHYGNFPAIWSSKDSTALRIFSCKFFLFSLKYVAAILPANGRQMLHARVDLLRLKSLLVSRFSFATIFPTVSINHHVRYGCLRPCVSGSWAFELQDRNKNAENSTMQFQ